MIILDKYSIPKLLKGYSDDQRTRNPLVCDHWKSRRALTFLSESGKFAMAARATAFSTLAEKQICFFSVQYISSNIYSLSY